MEKSKEEIAEILDYIREELTDINDVAKKFTQLSIAQAKAQRVQAIEDELQQLKPAIFKYNSRCKNPNDKIDIRKFAFSDLIDNIKAIYFDLENKEKLKAQGETKNESASGGASSISRIKLPKLNLPTFSGDLGTWPEFIESFDCSIHNNGSLTAIEKFQYLKGSLKGEALKLIGTLHLTAANYPVAYDLLIKRYQNKRLLANHYIKQIFEFKPISSDSVSNLQNFLLIFQTNVQALQALNLKSLHDFLLFYKALSCLDNRTRQLFEAQHSQDEIPTFSSLIEFVRNRATINSLCSDSPRSTIPTKSPRVLINRSDKRTTCPLCKNSLHSLYHCPNFKDLVPIERRNFIRKHNYCYNCLSSQHYSNDCKSTVLCTICSKKHHSLLHIGSLDRDEKGEVEPAPSPKSSEPTVLYSQPNPTIVPKRIVLLSTARVIVKTGLNSTKEIRVLIDTGSQTNLLTQNCIRRIGIKYNRVTSSIRGIAAVPHQVRGRCKLDISSLIDKNFSLNIEALIVNTITDDLPNQPIRIEDRQFLDNLPLADNSFDCPGEIDGILGAAVFAQIVGSTMKKSTTADLCAIETSLGYIIMGSITWNKVEDIPLAFCLFEEPPLEKMMRRFLEIEDLGPYSTNVPNDDDICESGFKASLTRTKTGQYLVDLPFKEDPSVLGDSFRLAKSRFFSLEKRFKESPTLKEHYDKVFQEYLNSGYMTKLLKPDINEGYYIPHHGIWKPTSSSTPLRVVFDGSAKTTSLKSLNDILHAGPKLQADLFNILITFRLFNIAITADIRQMYLRIGLNPHHRKYQRLLWRFAPKDPISVFELNTVIFGLTSSPYLALRVLKQLVEDEGDKFPQAAKIVSTDMYIDDLATSCESVEEGKNLFQELIAFFQTANFDLVKWSTNSLELLKFIPPEFRKVDSINFDNEDYLKVLGLKWIPKEDVFAFSFENVITSDTYTKRTILSVLARIYDPLGFLSCVTVFVKITLKQLWALDVDWDEKPPLEIINSWKKFMSELPLLSQFRLPRHLKIDKESEIDLVGFCDASQQAYGAVVYFRTAKCSSFVASKSKVAPLKPVLTIPRLELCSAVLLTKLLRKISDALADKVNICKIWAFSDSQIALGWIKSSPSRWQSFVANRVSHIQTTLPQTEWLYVRSQDNPADCISRSIRPSRILNHTLWFNGPPWLVDDPKNWPGKNPANLVEPEYLPEQKPKLVLVNYTQQCEDHPFLELSTRFSSWNKFRQCVVYILRFAKIIKPYNSIITTAELQGAEIAIFKALQAKHFGRELKLLAQGELSSPQFRKLYPFVHEGLIRVGGRLVHSELTFDAIHPILLPAKDHIVDILIDYYHQKNLHTGPSLLLSILRQRFWILSARTQIKRRIASCNLCFRFKPKPTFPLMGNLPLERVTTSKPFEYVGVDYMGPFQISLGRFRGCKTQKAWICVFVCLATKALHLELATELSTAAFLAAFKRFLSRRGQCRKVFSDQGTNFLGAKSHLDDLHKFLLSPEYKSKLITELVENEIDWHFNPPSAPHFGGLWEAQVKVIKRHLVKVIGNQILTYEEMLTVLVQIEALLNSRPLSVLGDDPQEPSALTPAHFLNCAPLKNFPTIDTTGIKPNCLTRPQLLDSLVQHWWKRWSREYLHTLQVRQRWMTPSLPIRQGMIVIVQNDNLPPFQWPLGIIEEVFPGRDHVVRVAQVRTSKGSYRRPVTKLCPLPQQ